MSASTRFLKTQIPILFLCPFGWLLALSDPVLVYRFDRQTVDEVTGTIESVHEAHWYGEETPNWVVEIAMDSENKLVVDLGPKNLHSSPPEMGSTLHATGSRIVVAEKQILLATKIEIDDQKRITIRNGKGVPVWLKKDDSARSKGRQFHRKMNRMKRMRKMH